MSLIPRLLLLINTIFVFTFRKLGILSSFIEIFICYCTKISLAALVKKARPFFVVSSECTRGNGHIKKYKSFYQNIRKNFLTIRVMEHWKRLPREAVQPPSLEMHILKTQLDTDLSNLLKLTLLWWERPKTRQSPKVPSNLSCSWCCGSHEFYTLPGTKITHTMFILYCSLFGYNSSISSSHDKLPATSYYHKERKLIHITCFLNFH